MLWRLFPINFDLIKSDSPLSSKYVQHVTFQIRSHVFNRKIYVINHTCRAAVFTQCCDCVVGSFSNSKTPKQLTIGRNTKWNSIKKISFLTQYSGSERFTGWESFVQSKQKNINKTFAAGKKKKAELTWFEPKNNIAYPLGLQNWNWCVVLWTFSPTYL